MARFKPVDVQKGPSIPALDLTKVATDNGVKVPTNYSLGLGWDTEMDLDISAVMLDENDVFVDVVFFNKKVSDCGSIQHSGDNLDGSGEGIDESITIIPSKIPANVKRILSVVNVFTPNKLFEDVAGGFAQISDADDPSVILCKYDLKDDLAKGNFLHVADILVDNGKLSMKAVGEISNHQNLNEFLGSVCK